MVQPRPPALVPGSRVAIACPAGPVERARIEQGAGRLREAGWSVVFGATCGAKHVLWAGSDEERAADLLALLGDPDVDAIFAARGGVGCMRILPLLERLPQRPRPCWIVGRSDLTAIHLHLWSRLGWIGLAGPMVATDMAGAASADAAWASALRHLCDPSPAGRIGADGIEPWIGGSAEGVLVPANLSVLTSLCGTPFMPSLRGTILVLEEINEPPHRIDRMLTQLRLSRALEGLSGLVFGQFTGCRSVEDDPEESVLSFVLRDHAERIGAPTLARFPFGHEREFVPLPVGVRARIETQTPALILLEAAAGRREGANA